MTTVECRPASQRFLLRAVPWHTYLLLRNLPENEHVRMTYDRGDLEMMSPSKLHEQLARFIERLIHAWTEELSISIQSCGSMTFQREDVERGLEPDNCYYVQHESWMRGKAEVDFAVDPPPDLATEVEITSTVLEKVPIYAAFRVPELWRVNARTVQVYELTAGGQYVPRPSSLAFPDLPLIEVERLLRDFGTADETALAKSFRESIRTTILPRLKRDADAAS